MVSLMKRGVFYSECHPIRLIVQEGEYFSVIYRAASIKLLLRNTEREQKKNSIVRTKSILVQTLLLPISLGALVRCTQQPASICIPQRPARLSSFGIRAKVINVMSVIQLVKIKVEECVCIHSFSIIMNDKPTGGGDVSFCSVYLYSSRNVSQTFTGPNSTVCELIFSCSSALHAKILEILEKFNRYRNFARKNFQSTRRANKAAKFPDESNYLLQRLYTILHYTLSYTPQGVITYIYKALALAQAPLQPQHFLFTLCTLYIYTMVYNVSDKKPDDFQ